MGGLAAARGVALVFAVAVVLIGGGEAAPVAGVATPDGSELAGCRAEPRSFADLQRVLAAPVAGEGAAVARRTPGVLPEGRPADATTTAGVTATLEELLTCFHAGEPLRVYGLYSDAYLRRLLYRAGAPDRAGYDLLATPQASAVEDRSELREVSGVRVLEGGRVGAVVVISYPTLPESVREKRFFFVFVDEGGRWLVDDVIGEISFSVP